MTCHQYTCSIVVGSAWESRPLNSLYSIAWHLGKLLISVRKFQLAICRRKCHGTLDGFLEYLRVIFKSKLLTLSCEWNINVNKTSLNNSFLLRRKMRWKSSEYKSKRMKQAPQERLDLNLFSLDLFLSRCVKKIQQRLKLFIITQDVSGGICHTSGECLLCIDVTNNPKSEVAEIMTR